MLRRHKKTAVEAKSRSPARPRGRKLSERRSTSAALFFLLVVTILGGMLPADLFPGALAAEVLSAKNGGSLTGRVVIAGTYAKPRGLPVFKNRAFCGPTVPNETLLVGQDGGVQNAVVSLHPRSAPATLQPEKIILDNRRCAFTPHVQAAVVGSELLLKNSDPILHTVHARLGTETLFNIGLPKWRRVTRLLDRPGAIRITCDVLHTWMSAVLLVTTTPYFVVTGPQGWFTISGLPVGEYRAEVWHEKLGTKLIPILLGESSANAIEVVYSPPARP
jgi:hypothetical protein